MDNDFKVILGAMIDNSSLTDVQKQLAKQRLKINADISVEDFAKSKQTIEKQISGLAKEIKLILGNAISDKQATQWANQYYNSMISGAKKAAKEQEKYNAKIKEGRLLAEKQSNDRFLSKQSYVYNDIIKNQNTIYSLKQKLLSADKLETEEINKQITALEKKNKYNDYKLSKNGMTDTSLEKSVQQSKESLENQYKIVASRKADTLKNELDKFANKNPGFSDWSKEIDDVIVNIESLKQELDTVDNSTDFTNIIAKIDNLKSSFTLANQTTGKIISEINRLNKVQTMQKWADNNTKAMKKFGIEINSIIEQMGNLDKPLPLDEATKLINRFKEIQNEARKTGNIGMTFSDKFKNAMSKFSEWGLASGSVMEIVHSLKEAATELKEVDTYLVEISKANDKLSKSDLKEIGNNAFDVASDYGKKAGNYLSAIQEASRAGYENAEGIAELSVAAQGAGDMTQELANQMIIATDKAYELGGSVEGLRTVLDGVNYITNHNAVNMTELSEAMSIVGTTAASFGIGAKETTAALGTMAATTQQSGSEVARAFRAILLNIRQVSDEEEGIDAEGLTKYENACNDLNVKLKETKDGVLSLRDPMEVLKELAVEYNKLDESDIRRTNLLNSVGGKLRSTQLDALLRQWDMYEKMLVEYEDGAGSMAVEAEKTANSWEGSLNRLQNTWTDTVENVVNSDSVITAINGFNELLSVINSLTDALGGLGTIATVGGGILGANNLG